MKCNYKGFCCAKAENNECVTSEDFACGDQITDREYQLINDSAERGKADRADVEQATRRRQI